MQGAERDLIARAHALRILMGLGFLAVLAGIFSLQVVQYREYAAQARENRQYRQRVTAPRGRIHDRNGVTLVDNRHQARLTIDRPAVAPSDTVLTRLAELLEIPVDRLLERSSRDGDKTVLLKHADVREIAVVEEHRLQLPSVHLELAPRRDYQFGSLASHLLGYVGEVDRTDVGASDRFGKYAPGDMKGKTGLEAYGEELLRGRAGVRLVEVNAAQRVVAELDEGSVPVVPGVHFYMTISQPLQSKLEQLLEGRAGAGIVMEVRTGDILASASLPAFEPNRFAGGITDADWTQLEADPNKPLYHRTLRGTYPPGSPYKLITAAAALERGRVSPYTTFEPCFGSYRMGNRVYRCWERERGHGTLDLRAAIVQSCDVYFYQLVQRLTLDELAETAQRFGFGRPTGVEFGSEAAGLVPDSEFYDERLGPGGFTKGYLLNNAIGQGELLVTPLQMVRSFAALGGDGHLYRPHLILARENASGVRELRHVRRQSEPICSPKVRDFLRSAMYDVVASERGTGGLAEVEGIRIAGKTGTAENPHGEDHAWFVAYAPADDPEVAVAVIVENSGHGGSIAAPIVGALLRHYFGLETEIGR